jgi:hypothetical protein
MYAMTPLRKTRHFTCRDDLWDAFEARAAELSCSVDWLLGEAMKRMLAAHGKPVGTSIPAPPVSQQGPRAYTPHVPVPPPPPVRPRKATGSFVGTRPPAIALTLGDQRLVVDRERFVIGRAAREANLVIRHPSVSRQHAIVERTTEGFIVVDMASTNGVIVNGIKVTRAIVRPGDVVVIGPARIRVEPA